MASATWRRRSEPLVGGQLLAVRRQVVVEPDGVGVEVAEEQGRAVLVLLVVEHGQDAGVVERLDDLELTSRRPLQPLPVLLRGRLGDRVLADPAEARSSNDACLASRSW